jgi:hypothetical protein
VALSSWFYRKKIYAELRLSGRPVQAHRVVNPYHAVGIAPGAASCKAVAGHKGRRYLSAEAPKLPLPACDARSCQCRFVHFEDRRDGDDRRHLMMDARGHLARERRRGRGSRATD